MFFDGKLDAVDLMAIEYEERREKLQTIVDYVRRSPETNVDIQNFVSSLILDSLEQNLTGLQIKYIKRRNICLKLKLLRKL